MRNGCPQSHQRSLLFFSHNSRSVIKDAASNQRKKKNRQLFRIVGEIDWNISLGQIHSDGQCCPQQVEQSRKHPV